MNTLKAIFRGLAIWVAFTASAAVGQQKNVIMFIGDGYGLAPKVAARMALGQGKTGSRFSTDVNFHLMQIDALKYCNPVTTHSLNSWITDSAPGTCVYSIGQKGKQDNEMIAMDATTMQPIETIIEAAKKKGYAVGLVTTARITHATPAGWASHIWERDLEDNIAAQYISKSEAEYEAIYTANGGTYDANRDWILPAPKVGVELDVMLGGGSRHFFPKATPGPNNIIRDSKGVAIQRAGKDATLGGGKRVDNADLVEIAKTRGYQYVNSRDALLNLDYSQFTATNNTKLLGLFRDSHMSYEQDRQLYFTTEPMLAEMTKVAIEILKRKSTKGFILMVESGRIDHLEHANCGGVGFVAPDTAAGRLNETWLPNSDREAFVDDGNYNGAAGAKTAIKAYGSTDPIFGSDYMIKEVCAYDYAIGEGRKLLNDATAGQTLVMASSDHECGGFAVVGLHDEADVQKNGTKVRTYAQTPSRATFTAPPVGVVRGDVAIGGWYPEYSMYDYNGYSFPKAPATGRRIVVAYGSNPLTNGNGPKVAGGTPGNHTPQDVIAYADDNVGGTYASRITGHGLLDNTDLTPIMTSFLGVTLSNAVKKDEPNSSSPITPGAGIVYPNPATPNTPLNVAFNVEHSGQFTIEIYNAIGQRVRTLFTGNLESGAQSMTWDGKDDMGSEIAAGMYLINVSGMGSTLSDKFIVQ